MLLAAMFLLAALGCSSSSNTSSSAKAITSYSLDGVAGAINETGKTIAVTMPYGTDVTALVAAFNTTGQSVKVGKTTQVNGVTANDFTSAVAYTVTAADGTTATYNVIVAVAASSAKAITAYSLACVPGVINETAKTITVTLPYGTDVTSLIASFTITGQSLKIGTTTLVSGTTANDFSSAVTYTVTAADSSTVNYTVTVTVAAPSAKAIIKYSLDGADGTISESGKTIAVTMPYGTDVKKLTATFTMTGQSISVGSTAQVSGTTVNDFSSLVQYTVTAADSSTAIYTVIVTVAASSAKAITGYYLAGVTGTIDETAKTIAVTMPYGTSVKALVAAFATTGQSVSVGTTLQISGFTVNNFTNPVVYTVTAADGKTAKYTVTVTVAESTIPRTGQTTSYATDDDGALQKGVVWPSPRFTDNGDQTVTDNLTGLMWTKDGSTPTAGSCTGGAINWTSALNYVACLNTNSYLGHNDWRLPNRTELRSLINYGKADTSAWLNNSAQGFSNVQAASYWTSTTYAGYTSTAWRVQMQDGSDTGGDKSSASYNAWPVRTGHSGVIYLPRTGQTTSYAVSDDGDFQKGVVWPSPRFTDNGDETIKDNLTGLVWLKNANCFGPNITWAQALNDANTLKSGICGLTDGSKAGDWRMPNNNEMGSLVNIGQASPYSWLGAQGFSFPSPGYYWTSTAYAGDLTQGWLIDTLYGELMYAPNTTNSGVLYVLPVRGGQ